MLNLCTAGSNRLPSVVHYVNLAVLREILCLIITLILYCFTRYNESFCEIMIVLENSVRAKRIKWILPIMCKYKMLREENQKYNCTVRALSLHWLVGYEFMEFIYSHTNAMYTCMMIHLVFSCKKIRLRKYINLNSFIT